MNECASLFCKNQTKPNHIFCQKCKDKKTKEIVDKWIKDKKP